MKAFIVCLPKFLSEVKAYCKQNKIEYCVSIRDADFILVGGGDGSLFRAIKLLHHYNLPFLGINLGTVGYLMNDKKKLFTEAKLNPQKIPIYKVIDLNSNDSEIFVNDLLIERESGQAIKMSIDSSRHQCVECESEEFTGCGLLIYSGLGSSALASKMNGVKFNHSTPSVGMIKINPNQTNWTNVVHSLNISSLFVNLNLSEHRPARIICDGQVKFKFFAPHKLQIYYEKSIKVFLPPTHS